MSPSPNPPSSAVERLRVKLYEQRQVGTVELAFVSVPAHIRRGIQGLVKIGAYTYHRATTPGSLEDDPEVQEIESRVDAALRGGLNTTSQFSYGGKWGVWDRDRAAQQDAVVEQLWREQFADVASEGKAVMTGGVMGAGKTTVLQSGRTSIDPSKYGRIDADMVKETMAARGMVPEVLRLSPMEAATLVHEESALIAAKLAARAYAERKNLIWDVSMVDSHTINSRMRRMREAGYIEVVGIFVDIPIEEAVQRVLRRHRQDQDRWERGQGYGGRYVPPRLIRRNSDSAWGSVNRRIFEREKDQFHAWEVWDNSGNGLPVRVAYGNRPSPRRRLGY